MMRRSGTLHECGARCRGRTLAFSAQLTFALLVGFVIPFSALAGQCPATPGQIEKSIHHHIDSLRASEYCRARSVKVEHGVAVAIYTAEGACAGIDPNAGPGTCSNDWVRYMVVRSGGRLTQPIAIGGKGFFTGTSIEIRQDTIEVHGLSWGPNDAMCCPQTPQTKKFAFDHSRLHEVH